MTDFTELKFEARPMDTAKGSKLSWTTIMLSENWTKVSFRVATTTGKVNDKVSSVVILLGREEMDTLALGRISGASL